jgi:hypothetical protein
MAYGRVKFKVHGKPPGMLQHNPVKTMTRGPKPGAKKIPSEKVEAENGTYKNEAGGIVFPMAAVKKSMMTGAVGHKVGRTAVTTMLRNNILDVYGPDGDVLWLKLTNETGDPIMEYEIDTRRVVVGNASILRSRPLIPDWYAEFIIEYDDTALSVEVIQKYLERAGLVVGWGGYRPQNSGIFGRFEVIETQVLA